MAVAPDIALQEEHRARSLILNVAPPPTPPAPPTPTVPKRLLTGLTSEQRKQYPIVTGVLDYVPDAIAMVAHVSYLGNEKHNPGQPLHHARGKSSDHMDCVGRHLIERDQIETEDVIHLANAAWRILVELQETLERTHGLSLPRGATAPGVELPRK